MNERTCQVPLLPAVIITCYAEAWQNVNSRIVKIFYINMLLNTKAQSSRLRVINPQICCCSRLQYNEALHLFHTCTARWDSTVKHSPYPAQSWRKNFPASAGIHWSKGYQCCHYTRLVFCLTKLRLAEGILNIKIIRFGWGFFLNTGFNLGKEEIRNKEYYCFSTFFGLFTWLTKTWML